MTSVQKGSSLTIEQLEDIIIINIGEEYDISDYAYMWEVGNGFEVNSIEWQMITASNQLIVDFTKFAWADQSGGEFFSLNDNYKKFKGKDILFCGMNEKIESLLKLWEEEYLSLKVFKTRQEAIEYVEKNN